MRVAVFFLYLCFFLLRGDAVIYAVTNYSDAQTTHQHSRPHHIKYTSQNGPIVMDTKSDSEDYVAIDEDISDEEANDFLAKKLRLLARSYATLAYDSILSYHYNHYPATPPFYRPKSDIYIVHRTLLI